MFRIALLYPASDGTGFDHDYYVNTHMPLVAERLGEVCQGWSTDRPVGGRLVAIGYLTVTDQAEFGRLMQANRDEFTADIANCTGSTPEVVFSEIIADH
ncbi:MAG: hypothetical protein QOH68_862 [Nocardioidaceae bacterium]|nr:hypothetical protein [Nocardioidaceae bacterium]